MAKVTIEIEDTGDTVTLLMTAVLSGDGKTTKAERLGMSIARALDPHAERAAYREYGEEGLIRELDHLPTDDELGRIPELPEPKE